MGWRKKDDIWRNSSFRGLPVANHVAFTRCAFIRPYWTLPAPGPFNKLRLYVSQGVPLWNDLIHKNFLAPTIQRVSQGLNIRLTVILKKFCDTDSWQFVNLLWFLDGWSLLHLSSPFIAALDGCLNGRLLLLVICVVENLVGWLVACIIGWFWQYSCIENTLLLDWERRKCLAVDLSGGGWRGHEEVSSQLTWF